VYVSAAQLPDRVTHAWCRCSNHPALLRIQLPLAADWACDVVGAAATLLFFAPSYPLLLTGRVMYGLGIGFAMHAAPAYIAADWACDVVGAAATLLFFAPSYPLLLTGRVMYGLGIGFAMHAAPAYIAETASASVRGLLIR